MTLKHIKSKSKQRLVSDDSYLDIIPAKKTGNLHGIETDAGKKIKDMYNVLDSREKIIFKLFFKKELRMRDISKIMHLPRGTISSAITRMKKKIKCSKT